MATEGRFLEILVRFIERNLAPKGVTIKSPERFYSNGKQIGEIDITIRGKLGSSTIFVGVECRDRPCDGPQGIDWLELIAGKKSLLKVDKMVAVSSTGFRPEAVEAAKHFNIDLLTVSDVSDEKLNELILFKQFTVSTHRYEIHKPFSCVVPIDRAKFFDNNFEKVSVIHNNKVVPFHNYIKYEIQTIINHYDSKISLNGDEFLLERLDPLQAILPDGPVEIRDLRISVLLWCEIATGKVLLTAYRKPESDEVIAYTGVCRMRFDNRDLVIFCTLKDYSPTHWRLVGQFVEENGQPFFPAGTSITLRHKNSVVQELEKQKLNNSSLGKEG